MKKIIFPLVLIAIAGALALWFISKPSPRPAPTEIVTEAPREVQVPAESKPLDCMKQAVDMVKLVGLQSGDKKIPPVFKDQRNIFAELHKVGLLSPILNGNLAGVDNGAEKIADFFKDSAFLKNCRALSSIVNQYCDGANAKIMKSIYLHYQEEAADKGLSTAYDDLDIQDFSGFLKSNTQYCK